MSEPCFFELYPTVLIRAESMDAADRVLCDMLDQAGDDVRCFGWTTLQAAADAADVFEDSAASGHLESHTEVDHG